ncbi:hypothetical protein TRVL_03841 [Trypanosoma vivax]|nr:hypothetical protein TRVL_03841 [Trypanosoma vivax]
MPTFAFVSLLSVFTAVAASSCEDCAILCVSRLLDLISLRLVVALATAAHLDRLLCGWRRGTLPSCLPAHLNAQRRYAFAHTAHWPLAVSVPVVLPPSKRHEAPSQCREAARDLKTSPAPQTGECACLRLTVQATHTLRTRADQGCETSGRSDWYSGGHSG